MTYDEIFDNAEVDRSHAPDRFTWSDLRRVSRYLSRIAEDEKDRSQSLLDALQMAEGAIDWVRDNLTNENGLPAIHAHVRKVLEQSTSERSD